MSPSPVHAIQRPTEREVRLKRLGRQIAVAREKIMSQAELGYQLGAYLDREIPQTTISRWEKGQVDLGVEQIRALEIVLGLSPGALLAAAGYVDFYGTSDRDLRTVVFTDPDLHPSQRSAVLELIGSFKETSRRLFEHDLLNG